MSDETQTRSDFKPELTNMVELLRHAIALHAERPMLGVRQGDGWRWITYRELGELVDAFRGGLASVGVGPGDRVAVISNNRSEWNVGEAAVYSLGACYVPMYEAQLERDWLFILSDCGAKVCLVANSSIADRIEQLRSNLPQLEVIIAFDSGANDPHSYTALLDVGRLQPTAAVVPDPQTLASLIYTSGTTGRPKGVKLSHFNLASNACGLAKVIDLRPSDRAVLYLPWAHVMGGCSELNVGLVAGCSGAICGEPTRMLDYLPEVKPTLLNGVPRVWNGIYGGVQARMATAAPLSQRLFKTAMQARTKQRKGERLGLGERVAIELAQRLIFPKILAVFGGQLRLAGSGSAKLSCEAKELMQNLGIELLDSYGMTEASACVTCERAGESRPGSVGKPIPGVRVEIDKSVPGVSADEGEIIIYGYGVMLGYWNQDELTGKTLTPDGGLRSGDLGWLDADGYLYVTGRIKELYKLDTGKYVAPSPLESSIACSPFIAECVVFGADKPYNVALIFPEMQALKAWAGAHDIAVDDKDALLADPRVRSLFEAEVDKYSSEFKAYECIAKFAIEGEALSIANGLLTPTLKVKRSQVLAKYARVLDCLYSSTSSTPLDARASRASYIRELVAEQDAPRERSANG